MVEGTLGPQGLSSGQEGMGDVTSSSLGMGAQAGALVGCSLPAVRALCCP